MARWLLAGHNPQETFGIPYPLSATYLADFAMYRELGRVLSTLAGSHGHVDWTLPIMLTVQGRMFLNISYTMRNIATVIGFDTEAVGAPRGLLEPPARPTPSMQLLLPFRFLHLYRQARRSYHQVLPRWRNILDGLYWQLRGFNPGGLTARDLATIGRLFELSTEEHLNSVSNLIAFVGLLNSGLLGWVSRRAPALLNLLVGRGTSTARLGERMWALRQVALQCGEETVALLRQGEMDLDRYRDIPTAAPLLQAMGQFLRTYGHRAFRYASEFESPRLADQPELVLLTLGGLLGEEGASADRVEAARKMGLQALRQMNPFRRAGWQALLRWGSGLVEKREEGRDILELQTATYGLAARLLSCHYFPDQPADCLWLYTFEELLAFGQSQGKKQVDPQEIERRRAELELNRGRPAPPELIWYDPETKQWWPAEEAEVEESPPSPTLCLRGIGASAGSGPVEGIALVTNSAQEAAERLLGTSGPVVLVTHVTDPVWSSLFRRLAAVVTEMGGAVSHAAIVARENGLPAVVGVRDATRAIGDGQRVRVDGAAGTVEVLP